MPDTTNYYSSAFTLGIIGGGQLGKMLLTETRRLDIRTKVLDPSPEAPCRIACNEFVQGSLTDKQTVLDFAQDCDVVTIEIENVSTEALKELKAQGKKVYPDPEVLDIIKNKVTQKHFYKEHSITTAPFISFDTKDELNQLLEKEGMKLPFVWKAATGGYDGKGVMVIRDEDSLGQVPDAPGLVEELIPFEKELAVVVARSPKGEVKSFPVVEMDFHPTANLVEYVFSPSLIDASLQEKATKLAKEVAQKFAHVGLLAVEMFLTKEGGILVNEVAPRVHNSGHLTIEGNITSQFDQHLRAILDLPLGDTAMVKPSVMVNLTGEEAHTGSVVYEGIEDLMSMSGVYIHLYGKAETRPFRKMGHVTITADKLKEARSLAKRVKSTIKVKSH